MQLLLDLAPTTTLRTNWFESLLGELGVAQQANWPDEFGRKISAWLAAHGHTPVRTLSLFSGGGGLDIGFHDCGFQTVEMVEVEEQFAQTLRLNTGNGLLGSARVWCGDIRDYHPAEDLNIDFIIGGPPCQTFSAAGRRAAGVQGTDDPRGQLFWEYVRLLKQLKPFGFVFENVYGIMGAQGGTAWKEITASFRAAGYSIFHRILDAADYGVPQHRERLFIVGLRDGNFLFPSPTHGPDSSGEKPFNSADEAITGAKYENIEPGINGRYGSLLEAIPPGLNYSFYTKEMGHPNPVFSWRSKFSDFLYKADPMTPVRTIKAQGGQYTGPFHWDNRRFSIAELKRLQTFPDEYRLHGKQQTMIQQIGNSVPPQIGRILALGVLSQVFKASLPVSLELLESDANLSFRKRKRAKTTEYASKAKEAIQSLSIREEGSNQNTAEAPCQFETKRYLGKNFSWSKKPSAGSSIYRVQFSSGCKEWQFVVHPENHLPEVKINHPAVILEISPVELERTTGNAGTVSLQVFSEDPADLTAAWKFFEEILQERTGKADLVQLSGYYQYSPAISIDINALPSDSLWVALRCILSGAAVAKIIASEQLAMLFDMPARNIRPIFRKLRGFGYEIRDHKTNPQIPVNHFLIPYAFPTLTPRSVQLHKTLGEDDESY